MNRLHIYILTLLIAAISAGSLSAQPLADTVEELDPLRPEFREMQITERRGETLPLDATFTDQDGRSVKLADYFQRDRPVVLAFVYYRCPMLCSLVLHGMVDALKEIPWTPGREYDVVVISFDHTETPALARVNQQGYLTSLNRPGADRGFHFLVGDEKQIRRVTDTVGFPFKWSDEADQYAHPSAIFILTPDGKISKYLHGVSHDPQTVRLTLVEASQRKIGTIGDRIILLCSHFDSTTGRYSASVMKIMNLSAPGMGAGVLFIVFYVIHRRKKAALRPVTVDHSGKADGHS